MIDLTKLIFIEKEIFNPVNGEIVGPYYHVYRVDENNNKEELFVEKSGSIIAAVREAERQLDLDMLAVAYHENPKSFSSYSMEPSSSFKPDFFLTEEDIKQIENIIENAKKR